MSEEYEIITRINQAIPTDRKRTETLAVLINFACCLALYVADKRELDDVEPEILLSVVAIFDCALPLFIPTGIVDIDIENFLPKQWEEQSEEEIYRKIKHILAKLNAVISKQEEV